MTATTQRQLFTVPIDETRLGLNQREVLARIDRFGGIGVRAAGRIVYKNRGRNPDRVEKAWLEAAGYRVLISLRERGLIRCPRGEAIWTRRQR